MSGESAVTRGRPRTFDREKAVHKAMELFIARGYDGVSLEDLQKVMGNISPPSFYAAFGSKDALFREVVTLYRDTMGQHVMGHLSMSPVRDGIDSMMRAIVDLFLQNELAPGCLIVLGAVNSTRTSKDAHELLAAARCEGNQAILNRLHKAVHDGELPKGLPLAEIAGFYTTFTQGLAVRARDGATKAEMLSWVDAAMAAWPTLIKPRKKPKK